MQDEKRHTFDDGAVLTWELDGPIVTEQETALGGEAVSTVTLPYEFPRAGTYRIWVQVKSAGRVYTGVFATEVLEKEPG